MKQLSKLALIAVVATVVLSSQAWPLAQGSRAAEAQLKAAQHIEEVKGDLKGAIELYKALAKNSDRAVAAKALLRMAASYEKLGLDDAQNAYDRVVREFADEPASAAAARSRLAAMQTSVGQVGEAVRLLSTDLVGRSSLNTDLGPPSADGRYLSFSTAGGLGVLDLKSGRILSPKNLGDAGYYAENSAVSPDGRQVAYVWDMTPLGHDLRVVPASGSDGATSRRVHLNTANGDKNNGHVDVLAWSPDGRSVVVQRELRDTRDLAVISISDGTVRVLTDTLRGNVGAFGRASVSPDGRYVAYDAREGWATTSRDIFIVTTDGRDNHIVVEAAGDDRNPMWSPDGSHIVFLSNRTGNLSLWMVPVAGGQPDGAAKLVKADVAPFSPLGITRTGTLYYIAGNGTTNVYTSELDGKLNALGAPSMVSNLYINSNRAGVWSPDGQSLAYASITPRGVFIRVRSAKTGDDREVPTQIPISGSPRWFPDGRSLLVASRDARLLNGNLGYYRVEIASGRAELLHQTVSRDIVSTRPDLSLDGKTIFYLETPREPRRFDMDSRSETRMTPAGSSMLSLAVSPDGAQIAYLAADFLVVAPTAGGEPRELVRFSGKSSPRERADGLALAWSPDQRHLYFVRPEPDIRAVWRVPLAGGEAENIGISMNRIRALRVHPDGRRILFDSVVDPRSEVWILENFLPKPGSKR